MLIKNIYIAIIVWLMMVIHILVIDKLRNERYNNLINGILMNAYQMLRFFFLVFLPEVSSNQFGPN